MHRTPFPTELSKTYAPCVLTCSERVGRVHVKNKPNFEFCQSQKVYKHTINLSQISKHVDLKKVERGFIRYTLIGLPRWLKGNSPPSINRTSNLESRKIRYAWLKNKVRHDDKTCTSLPLVQKHTRGSPSNQPNQTYRGKWSSQRQRRREKEQKHNTKLHRENY